MLNKIRKNSHTLQRKRLISRQKYKITCRRQLQFTQENNTSDTPEDK